VVKGLRERVRREYDGSGIGSRSKMIMAADARCWRYGRNRVCTQKSRHNYSSLCKSEVRYGEWVCSAKVSSEGWAKALKGWHTTLLFCIFFCLFAFLSAWFP
jgi:hypothetical protein